MNKENAIKAILEQLSKEFKISESIACSFTNTSLFLEPFSLDAISMTYLVIMLQERFHVEDYPECVSSFQNTTIEGFANWLSNDH